MATKHGDIRWKWLEESGFNVLADRHQYAYMQSLLAPLDVVQAVFCEAQFSFFIVYDVPHQFLRSTKTWRAAAVESRKWRRVDVPFVGADTE